MIDRVKRQLIHLIVLVFGFALLTAAVIPSELVSASSKTTTKTVTKTESISYKTVKHDDATLAKGKTATVTQGKKGSKKVTYKLTYVNGKQTKKQVVSTKVTKKAVDKVVRVGTYVAPPAPVPVPAPVPAPDPEPAPEPSVSSSNCDPNYSPCIPYYAGNVLNCPDIGVMVTVIGTDHNRFDADHDGYGCESYR